MCGELATGTPQYANLNFCLDAYWWSQISGHRFAQGILGLDEFDVPFLTKDGVFDDARQMLFGALRANDVDDEPELCRPATAGAEAAFHPRMATRDESLLLQLDVFGVLLTIGDPTETVRVDSSTLP